MYEIIQGKVLSKTQARPRLDLDNASVYNPGAEKSTRTPKVVDGIRHPGCHLARKEGKAGAGT